MKPIFNTLRKIRSFKPIVSVPQELKEQFDQLQLKNSIFRIRILGVLFICAKLSIITLFSGTNEILGSEVKLGLFDYILFAGFFLNNVFTYYYSHKNKSNRQLWAVCYLSVLFYCVITLWGMISTGIYIHAPAIVLPLLFFAVLLPDFQPRIFISYLIFLYVSIGFIMLIHVELDNSFIDNRLFIFNMFNIVIITKILLYNSKVRTFVYISSINGLNKKLEALSTTDELTKLNNRRSFLDYTNVVWKQSQRLQLPLAVIMIDIDYFKKYNDSLGHLEGDQALIAVAQCLKKQSKRETDFVARFGGEEFVCLLPYIDKADAVHFAHELVQSVENMKIPHPMSEHSKYVTISAGLAIMVPDEHTTPSQLLDEADKALYTAKQSGRNRVEIAQ